MYLLKKAYKCMGRERIEEGKEEKIEDLDELLLSLKF